MIDYAIRMSRYLREQEATPETTKLIQQQCTAQTPPAFTTVAVETDGKAIIVTIIFNFAPGSITGILNPL